jgi:hypothetical protein
MKSFFKRPAIQYCLLMLLGSYGVYLSLPIELNPQSTLERTDLIINLIIFVPSVVITVVCGLLAIFCALFSRPGEEQGRQDNFIFGLLKVFGVRDSIRSQFFLWGPLELLVQIFRSDSDDSHKAD